jgi:hypothetical protein
MCTPTTSDPRIEVEKIPCQYYCMARTPPDFQDVRRIAITALFSEDILFEKIVLKGGLYAPARCRVVGHQEIAGLLLANGANINAVTTYGTTHCAWR